MLNASNLADFPDSAYAAELRRGRSDGPFAIELEAQFRLAHVRRVRLRARVWFTWTFILVASITLGRLLGSDAGSPISVLHAGVLFPCSAALLWLIWSRDYEAYYLRFAPPLIMACNALVALTIGIELDNGQSEMLAPLTLNILAVFFFAGLMFRQALLTSVIMLLVFAATTAFGNLDPQLRIEGLLISTLACAFGGIVYRDVERSYRRSFLESGLLSELVARDALSGLMNRRAFDEHLLRVWQQAQRSQHSLAVIMVDIDHFKRYNDTFGHQAGDAALRKVAGVAQGFARRPLDLAARYGGEEFVLILYDLPLVHVLDIAERLRESVASLKLRADRPREETGPEVTVSLGVGFVVPGIGRTQHGAVKLADEALYEAKQTGRNRVCMNGPDAYLLLDTGAFHIGESARGR